MLYTLRHSPSHINLDEVLKYIKSDDVLLLIEDGVIGAMRDSNAIAAFEHIDFPIYALREDIEARGLQSYIAEAVICIGYSEFVQLAVQHRQHFAW